MGCIMSNYIRNKSLMPDVIPQTVPSSDIDGYYTCQGRGYRGTTVIRSLGDTFAVHGNIGGDVYVGVGIRSGSVLAVTFEIPKPLAAVYNIGASSRTLTGKYSAFPPGGGVEREVLTFSHELKKDWQVGDALLGNWSYDPFWYPGTIIETAHEGNLYRYRVRFADGDEEWLGPSRMMSDQLTAGDMIYRTCGLFHHGEEPTGSGPDLQSDNVDVNRLFRASRITRRDGDELELEYPDGRRHITSIEYIRTIAPRETQISLGTSNNVEQ